MKVTLIYAYWPNQPFGMTWCDLPWAVRDAGLAKRLHDDGHEVRESILMAEEEPPEELRSGFIFAGQIANEIRTAREAGELTVVLCGSCALAAVSAIAALGENAGIAWFDAHPDLNTPETTTSGILEGMAHAAATGLAWYGMAREHAGLAAPASLAKSALFGARDIDPAEQALIDMHGIVLARSAADINARLAGASAYVHLDMDVHDALNVRTNSFAVPDGPSVDAVRDALIGIDNVAVVAITGLDPAAADTATASRIAVEHILELANTMSDKAAEA